MYQKHDDVYLHHILDEIYRVEQFLSDTSKEEFLDGDITETRYAVVRSLEIIGEAASKIRSEFESQHQNILWSVMIGMRNKMIHEYMDVDYQVVWETAKFDLPKLKEQITSLLN